MLSKKNRVDKKTVEKIFKEGKFFNSPDLTLKFILVHGDNKQVGFITPKTISKKAVVRNLLRRRGYSVLKKYLSDFPAGFLGVFIFGKKSVEFFGGKKNRIYNPIFNLENEIRSILNKL